MIPRRFIRIWLDEPVPDLFEAYWQTFKIHHPTWEFVTLDRTETLGWMRCRDIFDACTTHAGRSDVLRYAALWEFGGVYVDTDVECLKSFAPLLEDPRPFAAWEDNRMICPTVMGSPPRHPAVGKLLDVLPRWFSSRPGAPPNQATGPHLLTTYWRNRSDVRLLEPVTFYPTHWSEKVKLGGPYPEESYAEHKWAAGWLPNGPPQRIG